jgi:hypothetical protein
MLILCPQLNARLDTLILAPSMGDTSPFIGGVSPVIKMGGVQLGLAFVLRGKTVHFLHLSVHFASMIDNTAFNRKYF